MAAAMESSLDPLVCDWIIGGIQWIFFRLWCGAAANFRFMVDGLGADGVPGLGPSPSCSMAPPGPCLLSRSVFWALMAVASAIYISKPAGRCQAILTAEGALYSFTEILTIGARAEEVIIHRHAGRKGTTSIRTAPTGLRGFRAYYLCHCSFKGHRPVKVQVIPRPSERGFAGCGHLSELLRGSRRLVWVVALNIEGLHTKRLGGGLRIPSTAVKRIQA